MASNRGGPSIECKRQYRGILVSPSCRTQGANHICNAGRHFQRARELHGLSQTSIISDSERTFVTEQYKGASFFEKAGCILNFVAWRRSAIYVFVLSSVILSVFSVLDVVSAVRNLLYYAGGADFEVDIQEWRAVRAGLDTSFGAFMDDFLQSLVAAMRAQAGRLRLVQAAVDVGLQVPIIYLGARAARTWSDWTSSSKQLRVAMLLTFLRAVILAAIPIQLFFDSGPIQAEVDEFSAESKLELEAAGLGDEGLVDTIVGALTTQARVMAFTAFFGLNVFNVFFYLLPFALSLGPGFVNAALRTKVIMSQLSINGLLFLMLPWFYAPFTFLALSPVFFIGDAFLSLAVAIYAFQPLLLSMLGSSFSFASPMSEEKAVKVVSRLQRITSMAQLVSLLIAIADAVYRFLQLDDETVELLMNLFDSLEFDPNRALQTVRLVGAVLSRYVSNVFLMAIIGTDWIFSFAAFEHMFEIYGWTLEDRSRADNDTETLNVYRKRKRSEDALAVLHECVGPEGESFADMIGGGTRGEDTKGAWRNPLFGWLALQGPRIM